MEGIMNMVGAIAGALGIFLFVLIIVVIIGGWKVFDKAGEPGWASIVPIYSFVVLLKIIDKPLWWIILMFVPPVNLVIAIICCIELAKKFDKGAGFGIGLAFFSFIFVPILGFGSAQYQGHNN